jgi:hypothetical protein
LAAFALPFAAGAEEVEYTGNSADLRSLTGYFSTDYNTSVFPRAFPGVPAAANNRVRVNYTPGFGADPEEVLGGMSNTGAVTGNVVEILNGNALRITGGFGEGVDARDNSIIIYGGEFGSGTSYSTFYLMGGHAHSGSGIAGASTGDVTDNHVEIRSGLFLGYNYLFGGGATSYAGGQVNGVIAGNTLLIEGGTFGPISGYGTTEIYGGATGLGNVLSGKGVWENRVIIRGGTFLANQNGAPARVYGGYLDHGGVVGAAVRDNLVIVEGMDAASTASLEITGGYYNSGNSSSAVDVTGNRAEVSGGRIGRVIGGMGYYYSGGGNVSYNSVNLSDARDGKIEGSVIGGAVWTCNSGQCNATYNSVTLSGIAWIDGQLLGGDSSSGDSFTGNTLNLKTRDTLVVENDMRGFEYLNFWLPASLAPEAALIEIRNGEGDVDNSRIDLRLAGGIPPLPRLKPGDRIRLIDATEAFTNSGGSSDLSAKGVNPAASATQGVAFRYDFDLYAENHILWARLKSGPVNPQTEALPESYLSGEALLNQGADFLARLWPEMARSGLRLFAAASGGNLRYNTGSHVRVRGQNLIVGATAARVLAAGELHLGAFLEHGEGGYNTYNSFANAATVRGKGDMDYTGVGAILHLETRKTEEERWYTEFSARAGQLRLDFRTRDLIDRHTGRRADYESRMPYVGLHARLGVLSTLDAATTLELYGQYLWNHQGADKVTLATGEPVKFHAVNSHRTQLGARWSRAFRPNAHAWIGLAWEHEYDGKAKASIYGFRLATPSMDGDAGILETGFTLTPTSARPWTLEFGLQGYTGKREGVTGSLRANYHF